MHPAQIGPYKILRSIGQGGMGEVFLGEDGRLGRQAAIKILPSELCESAERRQRFLEEARSASAINHPNACVIYDVGETDAGQPFIAMEFVEGDTLRTLVKQGPLATELVVEFGMQKRWLGEHSFAEIASPTNLRYFSSRRNRLP